MLDLLRSPEFGCVLLPVVAVAAAALLRWARAPGPNVLGGVLAGILLGPVILGRVLPLVHESLFVGGADERRVVEDLEHLRDRDLTIGLEIDASGEALREINDRHHPPLAAARAGWRAQRWFDQRWLRRLAITVAALTLLLVGSSGGSRAGPVPGRLVPVSLGAAAALVPGVVTYVALHHVFAFPRLDALIAAAAVAIGPGAPAPADDEAADDAELGGARLVRRGARVSTIIAVTAAAAAFLLRGGETAAPAVLALSAAWIGWLIAPGGAARRRFVQRYLIPSLAGVATIHTDLFAHFAPWPIVIIALAGADGRRLGATLGAVLPGGRSWLRSLRMTVGAMACAPTQLAVVAVGAQTWLIPGSLNLALVIGAVVIASTTPMRRAVAGSIRMLEDQENR